VGHSGFWVGLKIFAFLKFIFSLLQIVNRIIYFAASLNPHDIIEKA